MPKDAKAQAKAKAALWEHLNTYSTRGERNAPAAFAGRSAEIKDLTFRLHAVAAPESAAGMTTIIQGSPGVGKTALAREFVRRMQGKVLEADVPDAPGKKRKRVTVCVHVSTAQLAASPRSLLQHIHKEIMEVRSQFTKGAEKAKGQVRAHLEKIGDAASLFLNIKTGPEAVATLNALNDASPAVPCLDSYAKVWGDDLVIVLLVDEMQGCPLTNHARDTLQTLHQSLHKARVFPVLLGLSDTEELVTERDPKKGLGLSRLGSTDAVRTIGCLNPAQGNEPSESRQAITGSLDALGMTWSDPVWRDILLDSGCGENKWTQWRAALVDQLEEDSAEFPHHITAGLRATCAALRTNQSRLTFNQGLLHVIAAQHQENKDHYYQSRLAGATEPYALAFGALCELEAAGATVTAADIRPALQICAATDEAQLQDAPAGAVLKQALSKGILQKHGRTYSFHTIPSMASHLRNEYQEALAAGDPAAERLRDTLRPDDDWTDGGGGPK